jgi:ABC-type branched-subunit amino acid transport system substrate-binding protein
MMKRILLLLSVLSLAACTESRPAWMQPINPPAQEKPQLPPGTIYPGYNLPPNDQAQQQQGPQAAPAGPTQAVKVALLIPQSGPQQEMGQSMLQAAQLALFDLHSKSFELLPEDTRGTPEGAREAARVAISSGAQLILGPIFSGEVRAARDVAQHSGINMVAFTTDWTTAGGNCFILGFTPFSQVQRVAQYAAMHGVRRVAIITPDNEYGTAVTLAWTDVAQRIGLGSPAVVRFSADGHDINDKVGAFARDNASSRSYDAVLLPVGGDQARTISGILARAGLGPQIMRRLGTGLWDDAALAADKTLAGAWFAAPSPDQRRGFERRYGQTFSQRPQRLSTLAYDATALAAALARNGYQPGRSPFDYASLTNPNGFAGLDGVFRFRSDGLAERGLAMLQFRDMQIETLDPAPKTFQNWLGQ